MRELLCAEFCPIRESRLGRNIPMLFTYRVDTWVGHTGWVWELEGGEQRGCGAWQHSGCHQHEGMEFPLNDFNLRNGNSRAVQQLRGPCCKRVFKPSLQPCSMSVGSHVQQGLHQQRLPLWASHAAAQVFSSQSSCWASLRGFSTGRVESCRSQFLRAPRPGGKRAVGLKLSLPFSHSYFLTLLCSGSSSCSPLIEAIS